MTMEQKGAQAPGLDPPLQRTEDGRVRRVGVEVEFDGLAVSDAAPLVARRFGGKIEGDSDYRALVTGTDLGDFVIELDMQYAHAEGGGELKRTIADAAGAVGELFIPVEIIAPPIPYTDLGKLDTLVTDIRKWGAGGTGSGVFAAYGCHLNPEVARRDAVYITTHLKAYLVLSAWLRHEIGLDLSRRITPFIDSFPTAYARQVVDPAYWPELEKLIDDYLEANPTRNRELDMLPLFTELVEDRVRAVVDDNRIKPRPTFHYRLPNSRVDEPHWSVTQEWQRWLSVERLAADEERLEAASRAFCEFHDRPVSFGWTKEAGKWA